MSGKSRIDELDIELSSSAELQEYVKRVRDLCRDLFMELEFGAEVLQANLSTLVAVGADGEKMGRVASRRRARRVASCLRRAGESQKYCGAQAVKTWSMFMQAFAPEIDAVKGRKPAKKTRPDFRID